MSPVLGIARSGGLVFEGESDYGAHLVWPRPVLTPAAFTNTDASELEPARDLRNCSHYFREDFFDPVSRIRRGRLYEYTGSEGSWNVMPSSQVYSVAHPSSSDGLISKTLRKYIPYRPSQAAPGQQEQVLVILGTPTAYSVWTIVNSETISTDEELITLKARQSLGALPEINWSKIPPSGLRIVRETVEKLADDYRKAGVESVVDRAREAATAILSTYLQDQGVNKAKGKDLGDLVKALAENNGKHSQRVVACAAEIPQRLHSRGKSAEKEKREQLRPLREQDAELAVQCVGIMLCDLGWGEWK